MIRATVGCALFLTTLGCDMGIAPNRSSHKLESEPFTTDNNANATHISKWRVDKGDTITLPIVPSAGNSFTVDWGDGTVTKFYDTLARHTYKQRGIYTIRITGTAARWSFLAIPHSRYKILAVTEFGDLGLKNLDGAFWQAKNLTHVVGGDVSDVMSMRSVFAHASNAELDIAKWDTRTVVDMSSMFDNTFLADPDVSNWDVSGVASMASMFANTRSAQPDVSEWDVSAVEDMSAMFALATAADPAVNKWDTADVRDMRAMFKGAVNADPDVSSWDIGKVSYLDYMFADAVNATPDVSKWDTSNVLSMRGMFNGAVSANPDVFSWNTSRIISLAEMFKDAISASPRLMCWDVSKVVDMRGMFDGAINADTDLSKWNFASVVFMQDMFRDVRLATENYDALIEQLVVTASQHNVIFNAGNSKYGCDSETFRQQLIHRGWRIDDAGKLEQCEGDDS